MRQAFGTVALGLAGLLLGLAANALPAAAASGARLELSTAQLSLLLGIGVWTRALTSAFAGALVDRFGGRRSLRDAAAGAALAALALGALFLGKREGAFFVVAAILQAAVCYFLAYAGPAAARVNAARLEPGVRGRHSGLYAALAFPAELLALPAGLWLAARLPYATLCLAPAAAAALAVIAALWSPLLARREESRPGLGELRTLALRRDVLALAGLAACAGAARFGLLGWALPFLREVHQVRPGGPLFASAMTAAVAGAAAGPLLCGWLSDRNFAGRRAPAALAFFICLAAALAGLGATVDPAFACALLGLCCAAVFGVHSLLVGAASMDAGGRRSAGAVSGLLDAVHHAAGALSLLLVGSAVDRGGWGEWTPALIPLALAGAAGALLIVYLKTEAPGQPL